MSSRFLTAVLMTVLILGGCGGGENVSDSTSPDSEGTTTTAANVATTEAPATTVDDSGPTVGLGDIPQECIDAFVDYLQAIESAVADVDWANASITDFEEIGTTLEPISQEFEAATADSNCDDLQVDASSEESFQYMIELAQREAPGTVAYLEMIRDFAGGFTGGSDIEVSGDCETDIAAFQAIVDEGGSMEDRDLADLGAIGSLITSISANCSQDRSLEFFSKEDVSAFMGS